ncbi:outer membrane lipoprotein LolB [Geobacter pickeringii]|uniref:Outer-membrane lipoprotein LolB n=1 Tax=Geobacter pickeringii TaxID=345632 RepID=A0A0B5BHB4_9BACT|nr:outer membrane lipoprotein LolB [Geobacter pickeringii]AJE04574.1 membrane protein [Geobacter pickeringii]
MRFIATLLGVLMVTLALSGCATAPRPQTPFIPGVAVETLTTAVAVSVKSPEGSTGGTGYLIYRRPDRFHLVMLTPFGTTALEFFAGDDQVTLLIPSKGTAYVGSFADLPAKGGLQGWRMMQWVVEGDPLLRPGTTGSIERTDAAGRRIVATYNADGLLERKSSEDGEVVYRDYRSVDGVPFPTVIEFGDGAGTRVTITFDEPEVNRPVEESALTPNLEGLTLLPLASLKGV